MIPIFLEQFSKFSSAERDNWWQTIKTPIIEIMENDPTRYTVTFLYKLSEDDINHNASIYLLSGLTGYDFTDLSKFVRLSDTDLAYLTIIFPDNTRGAYNIVKLHDELETFKITDNSSDLETYPKPSSQLEWFNNLLGFLFANNKVELDSRNNNKITYFKDMDNPVEIYGEESIIELPNAPTNTAIPKDFVKIKEKRYELTQENRLIAGKYCQKLERKYWVYLPKSYNNTSDNTYPLLLFLDGSSYLDYIPAHCILEELINAEKIPPCIAIFLDFAEGPERNTEYNCNHQFTDFLVNEFIPNVTTKHNLRIDSSQESRAIIGSSMSACAAFYAGLTYPKFFGKVICQSPCFLLQQLQNLKDIIDNSPTTGKFIFEVGIFEKNAVSFEFADGTTQNTSTYDSVQSITEYMWSKGIDIILHEFSGGHNYVCYRESLYQLIIEILPNQQKHLTYNKI